jgi:hypothetical protein
MIVGAPIRGSIGAVEAVVLVKDQRITVAPDAVTVGLAG